MKEIFKIYTFYDLECPKNCTMEYEPVCGGGSNGTYQKTFDNMCALKSHACNLGLNITKVMDGPCTNSTGDYCCGFF